MGRFRLTATLQVYEFQGAWSCFAKSPRKTTREAFAELVALAHFHAAAIAHAASPHVFEMIVLAMLVGLVRRAEALQEQGILSQSHDIAALQANLKMVMHLLRQRLADQSHELYTFARALRTEDQRALRALLAATQNHAQGPLVPFDNTVTEQGLLASVIQCMSWIRRLEKTHQAPGAVVSLEEWSRICSDT